MIFGERTNHMNWRRGGAFGERAELPPSLATDLIMIDKNATDTKGILVAAGEQDGVFWTSSFPVKWANVTWWIPLDEFLATLPDERE